MSLLTLSILLGITFGTLDRLIMIKTDYRSYPSYLHGRSIHIVTGFIAACLGAVILPAIIKQDYTAVTFFTLAASQFREVRNMERNTLLNLDESEIVPRGKTYIEGIALVFEARNYLVIMCAFLTTIFVYYVNWYVGIGAGVFGIFLSHHLMTGLRLNDIADLEFVTPHFEGAGLYIGDVYIMNIGLEARREELTKWGVGIVLKPKNLNGTVCLANFGQRQAIIHDCYMGLGIYRDSGTPALVPLAKRNLETGDMAIFILPRERNEKWMRYVIENVPVLESTYRYVHKKKKCIEDM